MAIYDYTGQEIETGGGGSSDSLTERDYYCAFSLFETIGVVGDSYANGYNAETDGGNAYNHPALSWPQILARRNGVTVTNYAVALPAVGVLDMLRYHRFTIGHGWVVEYGSSEVEEQFDYLVKYSPLHNLREGVEYPATLITTGDHDDRVVPAHSFKFAAELQHCHKGDRPVLIRIDTNAGHGAGKPTDKRLNEIADTFAFLFENTDTEYKSR